MFLDNVTNHNSSVSSVRRGSERLHRQESVRGVAAFFMLTNLLFNCIFGAAPNSNKPQTFSSHVRSVMKCHQAQAEAICRHFLLCNFVFDFGHDDVFIIIAALLFIHNIITFLPACQDHYNCSNIVIKTVLTREMTWLPACSLSVFPTITAFDSGCSSSLVELFPPTVFLAWQR